MATKLTGAYVQAWVWVDLELQDTQYQVSPTGEPYDDQFVRWAKREHEEEGRIEFDQDAKVSRSYE